MIFISPGTQVEPSTADFETQCDLLVLPSTSTPVCSPVKSEGERNVDDERDVDYVPPSDLSFDAMEDHFEESQNNQSKYSSKS